MKNYNRVWAEFIVTFVLTNLAATPANAADLLIVVLENSDGGGPSVHQVSVENCNQFLKQNRQITKAGKIVTLTIKPPPEMTGKVLNALCIYPDGTTEGDTWLLNKGS